MLKVCQMSRWRSRWASPSPMRRVARTGPDCFSENASGASCPTRPPAARLHLRRYGFSIVRVGRLRWRWPTRAPERKNVGAEVPALASHLYELEGFGPALDHPVQRHRRGLATLPGAVEDRAVDESSFVLDRHRIGGLGRRPSPRRDRDHDQAGGGFSRARLPGRLVDKDLARLLLGGRHRGRARLLDLLDLRAIGLEVDLRRFVKTSIGQTRLDQFQFRRAQI